ncbi:hypothetical protein HPP92_004628 [Vanilla planifolia]|uniref:Thaumatin-like protein 1 n=1 Tax=Vanilla planifolia TaxID=51239 RepID=A0A835RFZ1_VANPL|nr:hypothetical protein HPP92_004983 [Vanilla planifolia]KAG0493634.1 hypothetical protein HPP92_004628 [Vanilla planifolia]
MAKLGCLPLVGFLALLSFFSCAICATFTIINNCGYTVWPGVLSGAGTAALATSGFSLESGQSLAVHVPSSWSGRFWGRTHCSTDPSTGIFTCDTGDCGSGRLDCSGSGPAPPATLAEFTLNGSGGMDFFDVSLVDGYNLPVLVAPQNLGNGGGNCTATGCVVDLNGICPSGLQVTLSDSGGQSVACRSACDAFGTPEYCCSGEYGNPNTCKPSAYSLFFKNSCPRAYSYAFDDSTSTFTCPTGVNYLITFCPSTTSQKAEETHPQGGASLPLINETMVFLGPIASGGPTRARLYAFAKVAATAGGLATLWPSFRQHLRF